jgi:hypothetical protein
MFVFGGEGLKRKFYIITLFEPLLDEEATLLVKPTGGCDG